MPPIIKKGFSVTILTALFTSMLVGLFGWFGQTAIEANETKIDVGYVKGQMETINQSMAEFISYAHENRIDIEKNIIRLELCDRRVENCIARHDD